GRCDPRPIMKNRRSGRRDAIRQNASAITTTFFCGSRRPANITGPLGETYAEAIDDVCTIFLTTYRLPLAPAFFQYSSPDRELLMIPSAYFPKCLLSQN